MARVAIVTGGTRGIGEAISVALKDMGMKVAANYAGNEERARAFTERTGIPAYKWDVSDFEACQQGVAKVEAELGPVDVAFQSRFGREKWLEPATDKVLGAYPGQGVKRIAIAAPGFSADCLETLEELGIRGRDTFLTAGGDQFALLECLNDSAEGLDLLDTLVRRELAGWLPHA